MIIIEEPLGSLEDKKFKNFKVDYVNLDWDETRRRTQKVVSENGVEIGLKLNLNAQQRGIYQNDVLVVEDDVAVVVNINETKVITVELTSLEQAAKVAYDIGNFHAPTFYTEDRKGLMTPYTQPMLELLKKNNSNPVIESKKLLNNQSLSSVTSDHSHTHGEKTGKIISNLKPQN